MKNILNQTGYIGANTFQLLEKKKYLDTIADCIRYNTLLSVARAGTGHLGASLSIIETLTEIYFRSFNFDLQNLNNPHRDIFILSKGHAAPSLYTTLAAKGYFPIESLDSLRRLNGLQGHCDIVTLGIEANTGSLAMGLSKAVGYSILKKRMGLKGNVLCLVGDGELQEGQCWEAFLSAISFSCDNLFVVIDDNQVQTDQYTNNIVKYNDIISTLSSIGFAVVEKNGRKSDEIYKGFNSLKKAKIPKLLYLHTVKGQGVSYMEHTNILNKKNAKYIWHNKPPTKELLRIALEEILKRIKNILKSENLSFNINPSLQSIPREPGETGIEGKNIIAGFAEGLKEIASKNKRIVVLDGDLEEDCGFIPFHKSYPKRFFEMGIMEQHIVSAASAFSRLGYIPVISTYAAFLTARANEQIYNLVTESGKALIVGNMAGILPATPGKSHQAFRDIACMKNIPGITMYQPVSAQDVKNILNRYFQGLLGKIVYIRLSMAASRIELATSPISLKKGVSHILKKGKDALAIGIGPVVLGECLKSAENLKENGINVEIWNHPWLIDFDKNQLRQASKRKIPLIIIEDHYIKGGFGESLLSFLRLNNISFNKIKHIGIKNIPQTGFRQEALETQGLDSNSLISGIKSLLQ